MGSSPAWSSLLSVGSAGESLSLFLALHPPAHARSISPKKKEACKVFEVTKPYANFQTYNVKPNVIFAHNPKNPLMK